MEDSELMIQILQVANSICTSNVTHVGQVFSFSRLFSFKLLIFSTAASIVSCHIKLLDLYTTSG